MVPTLKVLGISASLRNIRHGEGPLSLVDDLNKIPTQDQLLEYLNNHANKCSRTSFDGQYKHAKSSVIYESLRKQPVYNMSNSEILLAAGLWGAKNKGTEIGHVSLAEYFPDQRPESRYLNLLTEKVREADAILLSGPVYFGDRSSLAHDFMQMLRRNPELVKDKLFAGIAVGAKRNGGQETSLIYQIMDFINLGMLGVGNDAGTTAQYGGTGHAGDIGSAAKDEYGINTSIGTGNRIAQVLKLKKFTENIGLKDKVKIGIIILQDVEQRARHFVEKQILASDLGNKADFKFFYFVREQVQRCIGCDICPTTIDKDEVYRCIVQDEEDLFVRHHKMIVDMDAILLGGYSPESYDDITSVYQSFIERTRYLRRGDYVFTNRLVAPLIFQETGSREDLQIRIITSMIRHHTIVHKPILFNIHGGELIGLHNSHRDLNGFIEKASSLTTGRILYGSNKESASNYLPLGYKSQTESDNTPENVRRREETIETRRENYFRMLKDRVQY